MPLAGQRKWGYVLYSVSGERELIGTCTSLRIMYRRLPVPHHGPACPAFGVRIPCWVTPRCEKSSLDNTNSSRMTHMVLHKLKHRSCTPKVVISTLRCRLEGFNHLALLASRLSCPSFGKRTVKRYWVGGAQISGGVLYCICSRFVIANTRTKAVLTVL